MVELMEQNPEVARGMLSKVDLGKKWEAIAVELNSLGPPQRDSTKWQRVWIDQKTKIKKKVTKNKIETIATGGGPNKTIRLTDDEEAVSRLMRFNACVNPPGVEFGLQLTNLTDEGVIADKDEAVQVEEMKKKDLHCWKTKRRHKTIFTAK
ncbi:uncharacterized protein LOC129938487 [Eupeodes corollae]|uniref:uncharacterized protein LOC129938487 n=1 Tax=Eupeodes corollae TaxID=290404 RepID=UPI002491098A|nr:uncharacterized protein LOC129938487 [Eupeodes corollae]